MNKSAILSLQDRTFNLFFLSLLNYKSSINTDTIKEPLFHEKGIEVCVLRLDQVHPVISGNKLFKLHQFLEAAIKSNHKKIITFGGAYSNHLAATAYACREAGLTCAGIVRGERAPVLSHTLQQCMADGMQLEFITREAYKKKDDDAFIHDLQQQFGDHILVPEGGYHPWGARGASMIAEYYMGGGFTHIATAVGTATTLAGLLLNRQEGQTIMGFGVLKGMNDLDERLAYLCGTNKQPENYSFIPGYCLEGYAKKDASLFTFMNDFYTREKIPLDFIYTAKMLYGIHDMAMQNRFARGSRILCIHTGGLQGNASLPAGTLVF